MIPYADIPIQVRLSDRNLINPNYNGTSANEVSLLFKILKLTDEQEAEIRQSGRRVVELAEEYGVSDKTIYRILHKTRRP